LADVRADFEAGIIEYAATARRLSSQAARNLTPSVLERVLLTAAAEGKRALRRADLLSLIDEAALIAVPIEQLAAAFQGGASSSQGGASSSILRTALLVPTDDLPLPTIHAKRDTLVSAVDLARRACGLAIASGATGLGKSLVARLVAARSSTPWSIVDFRHMSAAESASRLAHLHGELAVSSTADVILDDLNRLDDPIVRDGLARLLASLRRRDGTAIVTTYRSPANTTLLQLAPDAAAPVEVPYFDNAEVADLVVQTGGEPKYAGAVHPGRCQWASPTDDGGAPPPQGSELVAAGVRGSTRRTAPFRTRRRTARGSRAARRRVAGGSADAAPSDQLGPRRL